jgi:hypothetical protein
MTNHTNKLHTQIVYELCEELRQLNITETQLATSNNNPVAIASAQTRREEILATLRDMGETPPAH